MYDSFDFIHFLQPLHPGDRQRLLRGRDFSRSALAYVVCDFLCIFSHLSIYLLFAIFFFHNILPIRLNFVSQPLFLLFFSPPSTRVKALSPDCWAIPWLCYDNARCGSQFTHLALCRFTPCLWSYCSPRYARECSFLIITQYLIISLPCLSQCLIGLLVTFPLH